jgi:hypothetical protein
MASRSSSLDDPARLAACHLLQQLRPPTDDGLELVEPDPPIAVAVGRREEGARELFGRLRRAPRVALGETDRDHPEELLVREEPIPVVIVHVKREGELLARGPQHETTHAFDELLA